MKDASGERDPEPVNLLPFELPHEPTVRVTDPRDPDTARLFAMTSGVSRSSRHAEPLSGALSLQTHRSVYATQAM